MFKLKFAMRPIFSAALALAVGASLTWQAFAHCGTTPPIPDAVIRQTYAAMTSVMTGNRAKIDKAWSVRRANFPTEADLINYARGYTEHSLAFYLHEEHIYKTWYYTCSESPEPRHHIENNYDPTACSSNAQCRGGQQCVGGDCVDIGGPQGDCRNNGGCAAGDQCGTDGICH